MKKVIIVCLLLIAVAFYGVQLIVESYLSVVMPLVAEPKRETAQKVIKPTVLPHMGNTDYDYVIVELGTAYGVEPALIKAMMYVESRFNPDAVNSEGAKGLLQVMPKTRQAFTPERPKTHLRSPLAREIEVGVCYMRHLLDRTNSLDEFLASYNAGPTYVAGIKKEPGWTSELPAETIHYIRQVKALLPQ